MIVWMFACWSCKEKQKNGEQQVFLQDSLAILIPEDSLVETYDYAFQLNTAPDESRGAWQNPDLVIRKFGSLSDKVVADIGSGTGYFAIPISRLARRVIAIDIEQRYLDYIEDRKLQLPLQQADRIETRLTVESEPNLHSDEVDAVLMVNVFYYLKNRVQYMNIVRKALKPDGKLVLVDFKTGDMPVGPPDGKIEVAQVVEIMQSAGFENISIDEESLQYQYIITAN
jgi:SAM-dependent methyltransferase